MKIINSKVLTFVFFLLVVVSCKPPELKNPIIQVKPQPIHITVVPNQLFEFDIHAFSEDTELRNIRVLRKADLGVTETILDTNIQGKTADFFYHYPVSSDDNNAILTFEVFNTDGDKGATAKRLFINEDEETLIETQGYDLFSLYSIGNTNAFNIETTIFYQLSSNPDSTLLDLVEFDIDEDNELSNILTSKSGIRFVKNNSFNYAEATNNSAGDSYNSSSPQQIVGDIEVGDLLITKFDEANDKFAVIKITAIMSNGDDETNHYSFNIKK